MSVPKAILFATGNEHKLDEVSAILATVGVRVEGLNAQGQTFEEPAETGQTFVANAIQKARGYAQQSGQLVLADDSGLAVDALGGAPGVYSARFAGVDGPRAEADAANNAKLLAELKDVDASRRTARFVCAIALCDTTTTWAVTRGTIEGHILRAPRGENGFGYDPLFYVSDLKQTTAELSPEQKNAISHRGVASRRMADLLKIIGRLDSSI
jgi:XTP/dITP diphosphohydrolase